MPARKAAAVVALAVAAFALETALALRGNTFLVNFRGFYCAGWSMLHGLDPYTAAALNRCEVMPTRHGLFGMLPGTTMPAPLPGFILALFMPLALLPYTLAAALWVLLGIAGVLLACRALARICRCDFWDAASVLLIPSMLGAFMFGEFSLVALPVLCYCALYACTGNRARLLLCLVLLSALPNVALPVYLAFFVLRPQMRIPLLAIGAGLIALEFSCGGSARAIEYFTHVLPAQGRSEIAYTWQYSMTWAAQAAGASDAIALLCGSVSYCVMLIVGIFVARVVSDRFADDAFLVTMPTAFCVFGGVYVHYSEIILALPAVMQLYAAPTDRSARAIAGAALVLLAMPWMMISGYPPRMVLFAAAAAIVAGCYMKLSSPGVMRVSLGVVAVACIIIAAAMRFGPGVAVHHSAVYAMPSLAQYSWQLFIDAHASSRGFTWWIIKAPTWLGLLALFAASGVSVRRTTAAAVYA